MFTTAIIVASGVKGGIERASKILMPALLAIILFLVIYALTLPDAWRGLAFYLVPDFSKLNGTVVTGAFAHAFFSLSLGLGALITYGSYLSQTENIVRAATWITLADVGVAFTAGLISSPSPLRKALSRRAARG
jgi:neurotransmitter:Na+ symporter, NSS family